MAPRQPPAGPSPRRPLRGPPALVPRPPASPCGCGNHGARLRADGGRRLPRPGARRRCCAVAAAARVHCSAE
eukprot:11005901-Alexandrium_andersonii.AAC.1